MKKYLLLISLIISLLTVQEQKENTCLKNCQVFRLLMTRNKAER